MCTSFFRYYKKKLQFRFISIRFFYEFIYKYLNFSSKLQAKGFSPYEQINRNNYNTNKSRSFYIRKQFACKISGQRASTTVWAPLRIRPHMFGQASYLEILGPVYDGYYFELWLRIRVGCYSFLFFELPAQCVKKTIFEKNSLHSCFTLVARPYSPQTVLLFENV